MQEKIRFCVVSARESDEPVEVGAFFDDGGSALEYAQAEANRTGEAYKVLPAVFHFVGYGEDVRTVKPKGVFRKGQCVLCSNYALLGWYRTPGGVGVTCCADCASERQLTGVAP